MERVIVLDKLAYVSLLEMLRPEERIFSTPTLKAMRDTISSGVTVEDKLSLHLISPTPEGPRSLFFQSKL